ncbi:Pyridoxal 5'-phosphate synthase subunit SNO1, partial [Frankliniella fusca]
MDANFVHIVETSNRRGCSHGEVEHGLTFSDLDKDDKMDFNSSVKIGSIRVAEVMEIHVPGSEGTQAYLMVMRFIMESCLDENLSASEKVYKIWYTLFFLRYWKAWLLNHSNYSAQSKNPMDTMEFHDLFSKDRGLFSMYDASYSMWCLFPWAFYHGKVFSLEQDSMEYRFPCEDSKENFLPW